MIVGKRENPVPDYWVCHGLSPPVQDLYHQQWYQEAAVVLFRLEDSGNDSATSAGAAWGGATGVS